MNSLKKLTTKTFLKFMILLILNKQFGILLNIAQVDLFGKSFFIKGCFKSM